MMEIGCGSSQFNGELSQSVVALVLTGEEPTGVMYTGPINLTDAKQVVMSFYQWSPLYSTVYLIRQKGKNTTSVGIATSSQLGIDNTFVSGKSSTKVYTRSSDSDTPMLSTVTLDVSGLTGNYYIKMYQKGENDASIVYTKSYNSYTGFSSIKVVYK